jgi:hypothetical protein
MGHAGSRSRSTDRADTHADILRPYGDSDPADQYIGPADGYVSPAAVVHIESTVTDLAAADGDPEALAVAESDTTYAHVDDRAVYINTNTASCHGDRAWSDGPAHRHTDGHTDGHGDRHGDRHGHGHTDSHGTALVDDDTCA